MWTFIQEQVLGMKWLNALIESEHLGSTSRHSNAILFLLIHSTFYRVYKCGTSTWSYLFLFNLITHD